MYPKCILVACFVATIVSARSTVPAQQNSISDDKFVPVAETGRSAPAADLSSYVGDLRFLYKVYQECSVTDTSSCLKMKLVTAIDRAARSYSGLSLFDGVTFVKDTNVVDTTEPIKSEAELEASLPRALSDREDKLNSLIFEKIFDFFQGHTLQVSNLHHFYSYLNIMILK